MEHRERVHLQFVKVQRLLNRVAAVVHEGLRLQEEDAVPADAAFGNEAAELLRP